MSHDRNPHTGSHTGTAGRPDHTLFEPVERSERLALAVVSIVALCVALFCLHVLVGFEFAAHTFAEGATVGLSMGALVGLFGYVSLLIGRYATEAPGI